MLINWLILLLLCFFPIELVDYILFLQLDLEVNQNENEVMDHRYFSKEQLQAFIEKGEKREDDVTFTPWFYLIAKKFLYKWWENLANLDAVKDTDTIHHFVDDKDNKE